MEPVRTPPAWTTASSTARLSNHVVELGKSCARSVGPPQSQSSTRVSKLLARRSERAGWLAGRGDAAARPCAHLNHDTPREAVRPADALLINDRRAQWRLQAVAA
jgi:hypothetical protein